MIGNRYGIQGYIRDRVVFYGTCNFGGLINQNSHSGGDVRFWCIDPVGWNLFCKRASGNLNCICNGCFCFITHVTYPVCRDQPGTAVAVYFDRRIATDSTKGISCYVRDTAVVPNQNTAGFAVFYNVVCNIIDTCTGVCQKDSGSGTVFKGVIFNRRGGTVVRNIQTITRHVLDLISGYGDILTGLINTDAISGSS